MKNYDDLMDELGSKVETRDRLLQQIQLLQANVEALNSDIERLSEKIDEFEEANEGEY
jgi:prefoldin subunit 5